MTSIKVRLNDCNLWEPGYLNKYLSPIFVFKTVFSSTNDRIERDNIRDM